MRPEWQGHYLDGRSAARRAARVRVTPTGLEVTTVDPPATALWRYAELRQTQGWYVGEPVRFERGGELGEALLVEDVRVLSAIRVIGGAEARRFHDPRSRRWRAQLVALAGIVAVGLALGLHFVGIPALASFAAARVPVAWETSLGEAVVGQLVPPDARCVDAERQRVIDGIVARLAATVPGQPYRFRVTIADAPVVNALAAPGGSIIVFRGLLEATDSPEELAAVLAHEVAHVLGRHATRGIFRQASTGILLAAITGDARGVVAFGAEGARALGDLSHSRQAEEEADREGMRMLHDARIDPRGAVRFFERLTAREGRTGAGLARYLATHPPAAERLGTLSALAAQAPGAPTRLLPDYDWPDITKMCDGAPTRQPGARGRP
jgi:predicted Zn-dependent protease